MYDIIIKNGKVIDGSGSPWFYADIAILNEKIEKIGKLDRCEAKIIINAKGRIVCPGFIDMHSHSDLLSIEKEVIESKITQGITTEVIGQDGIGPAPIPKEGFQILNDSLSSFDGDCTSYLDWDSVKEYLNRLRHSKISQNIIYLAPHGNIRLCIKGSDLGKASNDELLKMEYLIIQCIKEGASGVSSGLIYNPCCFADKRELIAICYAASKCGVPFMVHQQSEGDDIINSMKGLIEIAKITGVHLHFAHLKVCGKDNWDKIDEVINLIDKYRNEGIEITFDKYPYIAGSTKLSATLPIWVFRDGVEKLIENLKDNNIRLSIIEEMLNGREGWDSIVKWAGWEGIYISFLASDKNSKFIGKNIKEISELQGKNPEDTVLDLIAEEKNQVTMIDFITKEENIRKLLSHSAGVVGTDAILLGKPHPRAYGSFPRILRKYVREENILSLEQMIRKMTSFPARICGIRDRGLIAEGYYADIVIFDYDNVNDRATFQESEQYCDGIEYVIVNGGITIKQGEVKETGRGKVLNHRNL